MRNLMLAAVVLSLAAIALGAGCSPFESVGEDQSRTSGNIIAEPTLATISGTVQVTAPAEIEAVLPDGRRVRIPKHAPLEVLDGTAFTLPRGTKVDRSYMVDAMAMVGVLAVAGLVAVVAMKTIASRQAATAAMRAQPRQRAARSATAKPKRKRKPRGAKPAVQPPAPAVTP